MILMLVLKPWEFFELITFKVIYDLEFTPDGKQISKYIEFVDTFEAIQVLEQMLSNSGAK